jgi:c-di-GMP-binding flagellar brake protein YcgR
MATSVPDSAEQQPKECNPYELLQEACNRNTPIELHYVNRNLSGHQITPDMFYAQTRLLGVDDNQLYLDSPQSIGKKVHLGIGRQVDAYFCLQKKMYTFRTTVTNVNVKVILNREMTVVGICLAMPDRMRAGQRREEHRIPVLNVCPLMIRLHETPKDEPNACPINARRFEGDIINLSRGGICVLLKGDQRFLPRFGQWYYLSFTLPGDEEPLFFLGELRHFVEIERSDSRRFGFQFLRWPNSLQMREKINRLGRFLADLERKTLRGKRNAIADLFVPLKQ